MVFFPLFSMSSFLSNFFFNEFHSQLILRVDFEVTDNLSAMIWVFDGRIYRILDVFPVQKITLDRFKFITSIKDSILSISSIKGVLNLGRRRRQIYFLYFEMSGLILYTLYSSAEQCSRVMLCPPFCQKEHFKVT